MIKLNKDRYKFILMHNDTEYACFGETKKEVKHKTSYGLKRPWWWLWICGWHVVKNHDPVTRKYLMKAPRSFIFKDSTDE